MFEKAFHYFQFHQEEYMAKYHKRSNVESTFSAIKRKFGNSVLSKTDTAMTNEVLCKILCHNLTCLIQEQETLGIVPMFWKDEQPEVIEAEILPMARLPCVDSGNDSAASSAGEIWWRSSLLVRANRLE